MINIAVNVKGELFIDGDAKQIDDLTQAFLEKVVDDSLKDEVSFDIEGDMPLAAFFKDIQEGTKPGSELRKAMEEQGKNDDGNATVTDIRAKEPDSAPFGDSF